MLKKILLLAAVVAVMLPTGVMAAEFTFGEVNGQPAITGFSGSGNITVPRVDNYGREIRVIGEGVFQGAHINRVTFQSPSGIQTIGRNAFRNSRVNDITLPGSLLTIEEAAFEDTNRLTQIELPSNLNRIERFAFRGGALTSVTVPRNVHTVGDEAFAESSLRVARFEHRDGRDVTMGRNVFQRVDRDFRITYPTDAVNFGTNWYPPHRAYSTGEGFDDRDFRTTPLTGNDIMITGIYRDSALSDAERIEIPARIEGRTVRAIQSRAFDNLADLREVVIPDTVHSIEPRAFTGNRRLIAAYFRHTDGNIIDIAEDAFFSAANNFTVYFPYGARGFTTPVWRGFTARPTDVEDLWDFIPLGNHDLMLTGYRGTAVFVEIPATIDGREVRHITNEVFRDNRTLEELIIPDTVHVISPNAVFDAPNLTTVRLRHTFADTLDMSRLAFTNVHRDFRIIFPADAQGFTTPDWMGFRAEPDLIAANWEYRIAGGGVTITGYVGTEAEVEIPETIGGLPVRVIAAEAFRDSGNLRRVTIPASVTTVYANAFYNLINLGSAHFLHSHSRYLTSFASDAFVGVAPYFRIVFPTGAGGFTTPTWNGYFAEPESQELTLQEGDFEYVIRRAAVPGMQGLTQDVAVITRYMGHGINVTIPDTIGGFPVVELGDFAFFQNRGVETVTIPATVAVIGGSSFVGASSLARVHFRHQDGSGLNIEGAFLHTAPQFAIFFPHGAYGFDTPIWQGYSAFPEGTVLPGQPGQPNGQPNGGAVTLPDEPRNPFITTTRTLDSTSNYPTRDGETLLAPVFRLEPLPNPQYHTSYVMVRVIADILGLGWNFDEETGTATFFGYNAFDQHIVMELTIGSTNMRVNGETRQVRASAGVVPAISRDGRLFVPVMVFQEVFGVTIRWNPENRTVTVNP